LFLDAVTEDRFTSFVEQVEPRLRRALVAAFGLERGRDAAAEALAYGWEHWDRIAATANPAGYLLGKSNNIAKYLDWPISRRPSLPEYRVGR